MRHLGIAAFFALACHAAGVRAAPAFEAGAREDAAVLGAWSAVAPWPSVAIHLHVLPNGKVLFWDRSPWHHHESDSGMAECMDCDGRPYLWDPKAPDDAPRALPAPTYDVFCSGHSFLADGRLLVAGGHIEDFVGSPHATVFDFATETWTPLPDMNLGRWYPSTCTLANGDLLVLAGSVSEKVTNFLPQVFREGEGWRSLTNAREPRTANFYPFSFVAPNGLVFVAGPSRQTNYLDPRGAGRWTSVASSRYGKRDYGSAVMYEPGKVLILGGSRDPHEEAPTPTAERIDLAEDAPVWRDAKSMASGRRHQMATLLADGSVLVTGGTSAVGENDVTGAVLDSEIWSPTTGEWSRAAALGEPRMYHSACVLLPDARVLCAGGGHPSDFDHDDPAHTSYEIYSPPYLFAGARPTIASAPSVLRYGEAFQVGVEGGDGGVGSARVSLVRLSSSTHTFNLNQRFSWLEAEPTDGGVRVRAPARPALAPPGHYLLFVVRDGVPSEGVVVQFEPLPEIEEPLADGGVDAGPDAAADASFGAPKDGAAPRAAGGAAGRDGGSSSAGGAGGLAGTEAGSSSTGGAGGLPGTDGGSSSAGGAGGRASEDAGSVRPGAGGRRGKSSGGAPAKGGDPPPSRPVNEAAAKASPAANASGGCLCAIGVARRDRGGPLGALLLPIGFGLTRRAARARRARRHLLC